MEQQEIYQHIMKRIKEDRRSEEERRRGSDERRNAVIDDRRITVAPPVLDTAQGASINSAIVGFIAGSAVTIAASLLFVIAKSLLIPG
jgi:hypothetical protein